MKGLCLECEKPPKKKTSLDGGLCEYCALAERNEFTKTVQTIREIFGSMRDSLRDCNVKLSQPLLDAREDWIAEKKKAHVAMRRIRSLLAAGFIKQRLFDRWLPDIYENQNLASKAFVLILRISEHQQYQPR